MGMCYLGEKEFTFEVDPAAQAFLPPPVGPNVVARRLVGDGNCFFRGMSARQFGTQVLHLHVRLYVVGQLFLERGMYTSGAKGYDYNSFDQVALNEACSVVEFWGVNNPSESRILMHLAELYCVSEPRVFCSPLVRQGCSNSLAMEIQIMHPLVQLPAGQELKQYYCPLLQPYMNGERCQSTKRCSMMWTVATSDIIRDIRVMAALDEHVDFNHWSLLYGTSKGTAAKPYLFVELESVFHGGHAETVNEGDEDDPDGEAHVITSMHPLEAQVQCMNLIPDLEGDDGAFSNMYSILSDEHAGEDVSVMSDDMGTVEDREGVPAGEESNSTVSPLGPSFVAVPEPTTGSNNAAPMSYCWDIKDGDQHENATAFYDYVDSNYSKERNFEIRKESTNKTFPKHVPKECYPSDGIYSQLLCCVLGGGTRKKKEGIAEEKRRNRKSLKVGCSWAVRGVWNYKIMRYVINVSEQRTELEHTNGCNPSPQQQLISVTKRTRRKICRIPADVFEDIKVMFEEGQPISFIRARIRNRIPLHIKTDARWFVMLRCAIERQNKKDQKRNECDATEPTHTQQAHTEEAPAMTSDATVIPTVMRSIIGPVLRLQGLPVLNILERLRREVKGFMYNFVTDREGQLAGWCYMTPRQRASLEDNGSVLFFDTNAKGTNKYGMPFFAPAVMNQDNKHDIVLYGCCVTAGAEAIHWVLESMCKMVPAWEQMPCTFFSDDGCPEPVVRKRLPKATHLLCAWHIIDLDLYNCAKECE